MRLVVSSRGVGWDGGWGDYESHLRNSRKLTTFQSAEEIYERKWCRMRWGGRECGTALASPSQTTILFVSATRTVYVTVPYCHINVNYTDGYRGNFVSFKCGWCSICTRTMFTLPTRCLQAHRSPPRCTTTPDAANLSPTDFASELHPGDTESMGNSCRCFSHYI